MKVIEDKLNDLLVRKAPLQIPDNGRKALASAMPYLALIGGVLSVLGAFGLYQLLTWSNPYATELGVNSAAAQYSTNYGPLMWLSLGMIIVEAVLLFMAFAPLKARRKRGWDLLFWVALLNVVYSLVYYIAMPSSILSFIFSIIGTVIGFYLLFQVRSEFTGSTHPTSTPGSRSDTQ